jgi:fumarate hydratase class II
MPGKVNPVMSESLMQAAARVLGNDATIGFCGAAGSQFQLNIMMPVMGLTALESVRLLAGATEAFTARCLRGMVANVEACESEVERSAAMATGLNPYIGYEQAAKLAKEAMSTNKTVRQLAREKQILPEDVLEEALDPWKMTRPSGEGA